MTTAVRKGSSRGRRVNPGTVRIYKDGTARLSYDLAISKRFKAAFTKDEIHLSAAGAKDECLKLWFSNPGARSPIISLVSTIEMMGLDREVVAGTYKAKVVKKVIVINLRGGKNEDNQPGV